MIRLLLGIWLVFSAFTVAYGQSDDTSLKTRLDALYASLKNTVMSAPEVDKLDVLVKTQYWVTAIDAFAGLGSLNVNEPVSKLSKDELALLEALEGNVRGFLKSGDSPLQVKQKAQEFVAGMPIVKNQFQVHSISPILHVAGNGTDKQLTVKGSFLLMIKDSTQNYLQLRDRMVPYSAATDSSITFNFNLNDLGISQVNFRPETDIVLHLVGQVGKKINPKKQFVAKYHLFAMQVPQTPGKITVTLGDKQSSTEKQSKKTRTFLLNGSKGNLLEKQCVPSHDGWTLVPESVELVVETSAGQKDRDWSYRKTTTGGKICFTTEVFYNSSGTSGKLEYYLKYDIQRVTKEATTAERETPLTWGMTKQLKFDIPVVSVVYTDYNGNTYTLDGNSLELPGLSLQLNENALLISTPALANTVTIP